MNWSFEAVAFGGVGGRDAGPVLCPGKLYCTTIVYTCTTIEYTCTTIEYTCTTIEYTCIGARPRPKDNSNSPRTFGL
jgi:hypothetical protein